jgi:hypothetical protein
MRQVPRFTDVHSHHIEGWALGFGDVPPIPLVSHIVDDLWTGGCIDGVPLPADFRYVVSLYPWERYALAEGTQRVEYELLDAAFVPEESTLYEAAKRVRDAAAKGTTLVHCQAGLNRSGLVAGLALVLDGYTPEEAIDLLRRRRSPAVLCNPVFEAWLLDLEVADTPAEGGQTSR